MGTDSARKAVAKNEEETRSVSAVPEAMQLGGKDVTYHSKDQREDQYKTLVCCKKASSRLSL